MPQNYLKGFVLGQDMVHGKPTWKVRIDEPSSELNRKKARVVGVAGNYQPRQSEMVEFVLGSKVESGNTIYQAYDLRPYVGNTVPEEYRGKSFSEKPEPAKDTMNWFLTVCDGKLHANCMGWKSLEEAQEDVSEDEEVVAFIPFDIEEHIDKYDDPEVEGGMAIIEAMASTPATLQALEKLVTAIVNAAVKASK